MPPALVRVAKRKTTWNGETPLQEVVAIEFQGKSTGALDLTPSFYLLSEGAPRLVQVVAEHSCSLMDRPDNRVHVDAHGFSAPRALQTPGATLFQYTQEAHREVHFEGPEQLTAFVAAILEDKSRRMPTTKEELLAYVDSRLAANDEEWVTACNTHEKPKKWLALIEKARAKKASAASTPPPTVGVEAAPPSSPNTQLLVDEGTSSAAAVVGDQAANAKKDDPSPVRRQLAPSELPLQAPVPEASSSGDAKQSLGGIAKLILFVALAAGALGALWICRAHGSSAHSQKDSETPRP